jgi:hypothetical protein
MKVALVRQMQKNERQENFPSLLLFLHAPTSEQKNNEGETPINTAPKQRDVTLLANITNDYIKS